METVIFCAWFLRKVHDTACTQCKWERAKEQMQNVEASDNIQIRRHGSHVDIGIYAIFFINNHFASIYLSLSLYVSFSLVIYKCVCVCADTMIATVAFGGPINTLTPILCAVVVCLCVCFFFWNLCCPITVLSSQLVFKCFPLAIDCAFVLYLYLLILS